jgi:hypothetical protein
MSRAQRVKIFLMVGCAALMLGMNRDTNRTN